nr:ATP-binding cassette domain-containing protein [Ardenticatena sp.]
MSHPIILLDRVTYAYPLAETPTLVDVSLHILPGEFVLVIGESGSGKSTLLRLLNGLVPHFHGGTFGGRVLVAGRDTRTHTPRMLSDVVGFVFQDPESQFVLERVEDELVFGLEQAGVPPDEIARRLDETLDWLDIAHLRHRRVAHLSGGEKQRVAIASVLMQRPSVLVLDEPTSQLDPRAAQDVLHVLVRLNNDLGMTVVLAEHRIERVAAIADRVLWVRGAGKPLLDGAPRDVLAQSDLAPPITRLGRALGWSPVPLSVEEARAEVATLHLPPPTVAPSPAGDVVVEVEQVSFAYPRRAALHDVSFRLHAGEFVSLLGHNGSGKSTLLRLLVGLLHPDTGDVRIEGVSTRERAVHEVCRHVAYLPQNPNALLFAESVLDEVLTTLRNHNLPPAQAPIAPLQLLDRLGLMDVADAYPRDLSVGQRERVALAAVLATSPPIILLDEPTRGLDRLQKQALVRMLREWQAEGAAILFVSHDVEVIAEAADRVLILDAGRLVADGPARATLAQHADFAPQLAQALGVVATVEEVVEANA